MDALKTRAGGLASVFAAIACVTVMPASARAQHIPLAQVVPELVLRELVVVSPPLPAGTPGVPDGFSHAAHFTPLRTNELTNPVVGVVQTFNGQLVGQFPTFPIGAVAGGPSYRSDSPASNGRASVRFGPLFAERAITMGRGRFSAGFNYQHTSYDTFEGQNLEDGSIRFYLRHQDCCTITSGILTSQPNDSRLNPPFEGDLVEAAVSLKSTTHTTALSASYGVTDRWDVGVAVPFLRVNLDASVRARVIRLVTGAPTLAALPEETRRGALDVHTFEIGNPGATRTVGRSGHATGLGDIVVRTKYHFLGTPGSGVAAAVDVRLPTGDEDELLGIGSTQARFLLVGSVERGRFGQHVNIGYTASGGTVAGTITGLTGRPLPDEINYSGGIEFAASPQLSLTGDVVGRTLRGAGRLEMVGKPFEYRQFDPATAAALPVSMPGTISFEEFGVRAGDLTLLLGAAGMRFDLKGNLLVSGSVLFPLTDAGLRSRTTTVLGFGYSF